LDSGSSLQSAQGTTPVHIGPGVRVRQGRTTQLPTNATPLATHTHTHTHLMNDEGTTPPP
jgi:hypothetical protein